MDKVPTDDLIQEANRMLAAASEELMRSEEDVTSHLVCINARQSIVNYLISFLQKNGETPKAPVTVAGLMEQCRSLDGRFNLIDLTPLACRHKEGPEDYCLDVGTVSDCLKVARQTQAIALDESPAY